MATNNEVCTVQRDEQLVLNTRQEETVGHALVLLEGVIEPFRNELSTNELRLGQDETALRGQNLKTNSEASEVFISYKGQCSSWPVVDNRFKAFVKLDKGMNLLEIQCCKLKGQKKFSICYEKKHQERFVRVVYIKCSDSDGSFDAPDDVENTLDTALQKLRFNSLLMQTFMAEEMNRHGFGYQTFQLEEDVNDEVLVHVFTSELTTDKAHQMNGDELYAWFYKELTNSPLNDPNCKFLAFMSCSHYDPPDEINPKDIPRYVKAHTALGGGKLGLFGTAGLHTWAGEAGELVKCFTDCKEVDKKKLFDDSAGRGTFWANYSTTLGAALHELGHCFDLMHMPEGIMARGFDDMNRFVVATPSSRHCPCPAQSTGITSAVTTAMGMFADHRAHWFRSSAVLLHYHRWLQPCSKAPTTATQKPRSSIYVNWSHDVKGPIGNGGGGQENQSYFDDVAWHKSRGLTPAGFVVYHEEYINAVVPLAATISDQDPADGCPVYGKIDQKCAIHTFTLEEGEYLTSVEIRAGAWVDGIRFNSNIKSSIWFGGSGGEWYRLTPSDGECIAGIFGSFGDYLGSIGLRLSKCPDQSGLNSTPRIQSDIGIGLVELRKKDELINFWEFVQCAPTEFNVPKSWWETGTSPEEIALMAVDIDGNICRCGFLGYEQFTKGSECCTFETDGNVLKTDP